MADGATGMRGGTQLPVPIALAASFSRAAAGRFGDMLGSETRSMGYGVVRVRRSTWPARRCMGARSSRSERTRI